MQEVWSWTEWPTSLAGHPHRTGTGEKALVGGNLETGQPQKQGLWTCQQEPEQGDHLKVPGWQILTGAGMVHSRAWQVAPLDDLPAQVLVVTSRALAFGAVQFPSVLPPVPFHL